MSFPIAFALILFLAVAFGLTNGFLGGGSLVSTIVTTRVLDPLPALILVAVCEVAGLALLGRAVAWRLGHELIDLPAAADPAATLATIAIGVSGALLWNLWMWKAALPSSSSHALIGGLSGAALAIFGRTSVQWGTFARLALFLVAVPALALASSVALVRLTYWLGGFLVPAASRVLRAAQILVLALLAMAHGSNDGQKSLAVMLLAAAVGSHHWPAHAPFLSALAAGALAAGVFFGSQRTLRTLGRRFYRLEEEQGFCAQMSTMLLMTASSCAGYPMSTGHVLSASIIGAGAGLRPRSVRWALVGELGLAWFLTIPAAAAVSVALSFLWRGIVHVVS